MGAIIRSEILGLEGQVIKEVQYTDEGGIRIVCNRDKRRRPCDHPVVVKLVVAKSYLLKPLF